MYNVCKNMSNIEKKPFIQRIDKKIRIAAAGVVLAASLGMGNGSLSRQISLTSREFTTTISGETAQPRLTSENWMTIPQSEIKKYSVVPNIADGLIDDKEYLQPYPPLYRKQAKALGIYHYLSGRFPTTQPEDRYLRRKGNRTETLLPVVIMMKIGVWRR